MRIPLLPLLALAICLAVIAVGCAPAPASTPGDVLAVGVSIAPEKYMVERIGGAHVHVTVLVPPGAEAHTYEPKPEQLKALSQARLYFAIGLEFEGAWLPRLMDSRHGPRVVDLRQGITLLPSVEGKAYGGESTPDPHIWLAPSLVQVQAQTIHAALLEADPAHRAEYDVNLAGFQQEIAALDADIRAQLASVPTRQFMVFHPSWGYFAQEYGLEMLPIEIGGQEPSAQEMAALIAQAKTAGIRVIFAEPTFSTRSAETIAREIGGHVLLLDPLAGDWAANLRHVARELAQALATN